MIGKPPCDEGVIRGTSYSAPAPPRAGNWILAATILGSGMAFIDASVVNVALPALQAGLHATISDVQWIIEGYSLFLSALLLFGGALGDHFGRKRIFGLGIALFTLASVACGFAQTTAELIVARSCQGVGGALLVPGSLAIISASFDDESRGRAIGIWSGFSAITSGFAPLLGGLLIDHLSWRAIFFINVPLAAAVLVLLARHVPESRDESAARLDLPGSALATVGLGGVVFGLIESNSLGFDNALVLVPMAVGIAALALFVLVEARIATPMMPLSLFRSRTFSGANLLTVLLYGALVEITFFLPFNLIQVQGYTATEAGAAFIPFVLIMFLLSRWSGGLADRIGARVPLIVGPVVTAIGFALFALPGVGGSFWTTFFPPVLVMGLGMAIAVAPLTTAVMDAVSEEHAGIASGVNNAASRTAGLLSIAALSIVVLQIFSAQLDQRLARLAVSPGLQRALDAQRIKLAGVVVPHRVSGPLRDAIHGAIAQSFVTGFRVAALIAAALALLSAAMAAPTIQGKRAAAGEREPVGVPQRGSAGPAPSPSITPSPPRAQVES